MSSRGKKKDKFKSSDDYEDQEEFFSEDQFVLKSLMIHVIAIAIKAFVGLYGYSGEHVPPKFGDFEAQRHWMELTIGLNITEWYSNSIINPKEYWPMDYPPMSGYHSYILGIICKIIYPQAVEPFYSRGFESPILKIIMRLFALFSDVLFFHVSVNLLLKFLFINRKEKNDFEKYYTLLFLILVSPCLIIIDNGHFQYNNVMHGLFVLSVYFLFKHQFIFAIITYAMCMNFKQMGMYYAIPFPLYVIRYLFKNSNISFTKKFFYLILYFITALACLSLIWSPWIVSNKYKDVLERILPLWRGIFEDKVATFWCVLNVVYKLGSIEQNKLLKCSLLLTVVSCVIPSLCILFGKGKKKVTTRISFFIISFAFYLFSFHVHEKTIIVVYLAYILSFYELKEILPSFGIIAMFSMKPMLEREEQVFTYAILVTMFYIISVYVCGKREGYAWALFTLFEIVAIIFVISYHILELYIEPPKKYPWLYPMINAAFSFGYFMFIFLYTNLRLIEISFFK